MHLRTGLGAVLFPVSIFVAAHGFSGCGGADDGGEQAGTVTEVSATGASTMEASATDDVSPVAGQTGVLTGGNQPFLRYSPATMVLAGLASMTCLWPGCRLNQKRSAPTKPTMPVVPQTANGQAVSKCPRIGPGKEK